jgi:hypothetical protein
MNRDMLRAPSGGLLFPCGEEAFVACAATGHFSPSCRAGKYLSLMPGRGKYFLLDQKVFKKSKQNDASARKARSPPFCWAYPLIVVIMFLVVFSGLLVSIGIK